MKLTNLFEGIFKIRPLLVLLVLICFSGRSQTTEEIITVNVLDAKQSKLNISQIANDIKYLPLGNDIPMSNIVQVEYFDGQYFISDKVQRFLRFDNEGKFLNQIGNICTSSIFDLVRKEIFEGKSWLRIRNQAPCNKCVYQWLCPSPSDHEIVIGRPNLCKVTQQ